MCLAGPAMQHQQRAGWTQPSRRSSSLAAGPQHVAAGRRIRAAHAVLSPASELLSQNNISQPEAAPSSHLVPTHFIYDAGKFAGREGVGVEIWGSFNSWSAPVHMHCAGEPSDTPYRAIILVQPGPVEYKFKVAGAWVTSLEDETVSTFQGGLNNYRVVQPTLNFNIFAPNVHGASVVGSWDNWQYSLPLEQDPSSGQWTGCSHLRPGQYCFQYILDQRMVHSEEHEAAVYPGRGVVNMAWAVDKPVFRIFYCSGWGGVQLNYQRVLPGEDSASQDFESLLMVSASSCGNELGSWFTGAVVPLAEGESLRFYLTNGKTDTDLKEDRPKAANSAGQRLYTLPRAGAFKLSWGSIRPFPRGAEPRFMLVSDIDGTMIGSHGDPTQYASSRRFRDYWENGPSLNGSILVYNTGRSMGQVKELLKTVADVATPDAMVVAVGTKVFLNMEEVARGRTTGLNWVEDLEWTRQLDVGWDLAYVRRQGQKLMTQYGASGQLSVLDDGSEHQHRFSLSADIHIVELVADTMLTACKTARLDVRVIVSGNGSHRYVDCVPMRAGKEKALQFLRAKYSVPEHACVAAGDSGNDILMLEGNHPSIVVGNAQAELLSWMVEQPQCGKCVLADAFYADGIMEGLARHGLF